jgi:hypothetical protein
MSVHIGEINSQVDVQGAPGGAAGQAGLTSGDGAGVPVWEARERHRRLLEDEQRRRARLAGEGFDG